MKRFTTFTLGVLLAVLVLNAGASFSPTQSAQADGSLPPIPGGLPSSFTLGLANQADNIGWMTGSGVGWNSRYQYITGGVNTDSNWKTWNSPAGMYASYYMEDSARAGYLPVETYYQLLQSSPSSGNNEIERDFNNLNNYSTMWAYYDDFKLLMVQARNFGKPVIVQIEPDLMGFLQKRSTNPNNLSAVVGSSGYSDVAGYPNTVAGFNQAMVGLRNKYAPNVLLAYHISTWASSFGDISTSSDPNFNTQGAAQETASFYQQTGANYDLLFYDVADRDAALYQSWGNPNTWWDVNNVTFPNFNRFHQYTSLITTQTGKRGMLWQVPIGNTVSRTMNNTNHHWQDNRAQYYLNNSGNQHLQDLANSGIIGILFGGGDSNCTSYYDSAYDGVTNPNPINGNNAWSNVSDDDGGYLRQQAQAYYARGGLSLPSSGTPPAPPAPSVWQLSASTSGTLTNGSTVTVSANFAAPANTSGTYLVDIEVYDLNTNQKVKQWWGNQSFTAGQPQTLTNSLQVQTGRYQVRLGIFTTNWSNIAWLQNGPTYQVN